MSELADGSAFHDFNIILDPIRISRFPGFKIKKLRKQGSKGLDLRQPQELELARADSAHMDGERSHKNNNKGHHGGSGNR